VRVEEARHWRKFLPQTTAEDTVLDLVDEQRRPEAVIGLITTACQKRLTSPIRLTQAVAKRKRLRWRKLVVELLTAVEEGVESPLEWRYARDVERAHGLPRGKRQARANHKGRIYLRDVFYEEYQTVVELDGRAAHPDDEAHRDMRRDNAAAERAEVTLRYGWPDVAGRPCQVAVQVAGFLTARGWGDSPTRCGPQCLIPSRRS
jgi:very-short-patch-repair endonuclease